jgi:flagellar biosynthesis/type III secretory pathway M-ring protein FliF/YscJ
MLAWILFCTVRPAPADSPKVTSPDFSPQEPTAEPDGGDGKLSPAQLAILGVVLVIVVAVVILIVIAVICAVRRASKQYSRRPHDARAIFGGPMVDAEMSEFSEAAAAATGDIKGPDVS